MVEGFYGRPWTLRERLALIDWLHGAGLNAYLYAPKDDLKHRVLWREPYTRSEAAGLRAVADACRERGVQFIYAIAPGLDLAAAKPKETATLIAKLDQVRRLGASHCAILWDDLPAGLSQEDRRLYGTVAAVHCAVANRVADALEPNPASCRLLFCPPSLRAHGRAVRPIALPAGDRRKPDRASIPLDRPAHCLRDDSDELDSRVGQIVGRKPILWDNLHANGEAAGGCCRRPGARTCTAAGNRQGVASQLPVRRELHTHHTLGDWCRSAPPHLAPSAGRQPVPAFTCRGRGFRDRRHRRSRISSISRASWGIVPGLPGRPETLLGAAPDRWSTVERRSRRRAGGFWLFATS